MKKNVLIGEKKNLLIENKDIKKEFEKLVEGKKKLEMILGAQRSFGDKQKLDSIHSKQVQVKLFL